MGKYPCLPMKNKKDKRGLKLDVWQERVFRHKGNVVLRTGRQVGKSTVVSIKCHQLALDYPGTTTLVLAASQRQSSLLFERIRVMFDEDNTANIKEKTKNKEFKNLKEKRDAERENSIYVTEPTQTKIELKNGSIVYCVPTGKTGAYIRGFTVDFLIADEAARIPEEVWVAIVPMMATSKNERGTGWQILLSTPLGKHGYFYAACKDKDFLQIHVSSEKCKRIKKSFLTKERKRLTKLQYAQEYLAEFIEAYSQFFGSDLIKSCETIKAWDYNKDYDPMQRYYLGVDVARYGTDANAFVIVEMDREKNLKVVEASTSEGKSITETIGRIRALQDKFNFRKIFIDGVGVGGGVVDALKDSFSRKIVELNNANRAIDENDNRRKKILKEDLYSNARVMMEQGKIKMIECYDLKSSIGGVIFEYTEQGNLRIYGRNDHLAEAFVRACWSIKEMGLRLFLR